MGSPVNLGFPGNVVRFGGPDGNFHPSHAGRRHRTGTDHPDSSGSVNRRLKPDLPLPSCPVKTGFAGNPQGVLRLPVRINEEYDLGKKHLLLDFFELYLLNWTFALTLLRLLHTVCGIFSDISTDWIFILSVPSFDRSI
jgi:hypothetical protein